MPKTRQKMDHQVGERLRQGRVLAQMSQSEIAEALGVTFQQVQKYERGANRISAGRLFEIAKILGVPVDYFFLNEDEHGSASPNGAANGHSAPLLSKDAIRVAGTYSRIKSARLRKLVLHMIEELANADDTRG
jgi:transcriptional regulator with XRE-family HTH domain